MINDLKIFILINGHEVVCNLVSEEPNYYLVDQPFGIQMVPTKDGSTYGLQLVPFCINPFCFWSQLKYSSLNLIL